MKATYAVRLTLSYAMYGRFHHRFYLVLPLYGNDRNDRTKHGERINENVITVCRITAVEQIKGSNSVFRI
jgi:hypothetical protein